MARSSHDIAFDVAYGASNRQALASLVDAVNAADIGVDASLVEGAGTVSVKLTGETGDANAFSLSGQAVTAAGLDTVTQNARNAAFTVNDAYYTQPGNQAFLLNGKLELELRSVGSATVRVGPDTDAITNAVEDLTVSMNAFTSYLASNGYLDAGLSRSWARLIDMLGPTLEQYGIDRETGDQLTMNVGRVLPEAGRRPDRPARGVRGVQRHHQHPAILHGHRGGGRPGAQLLDQPPRSGFGSLYLRSLTSAPAFRQGSSLFWATV